MWHTDHDMVRGSRRFSWVAGWVAFGCAAAVCVLGFVTIAVSDRGWPGVLIAGGGGALMVVMLGRLQKVSESRAKVRYQRAADTRVSDTAERTSR